MNYKIQTGEHGLPCIVKTGAAIERGICFGVLAEAKATAISRLQTEIENRRAVIAGIRSLIERRVSAEPEEPT